MVARCGLELRDEQTALLLTADLPPIPAADRALDEVRTGKVGGLSVEFRAVKESVVDGIRVIHEAILAGVGLVISPSYSAASVEARAQRRRIWL